ncbi:C6 finger domain protein [Akanthomyces lecanii RCEF 1005]|uniref:C6 finger domain protein n=2 Tax=Akanthomyces TaxID=150366 RepID=A0A168F9K6_CORDF|nr:C6 finger domain protein [Akanthomyces lecanii RCEF 1005]
MLKDEAFHNPGDSIYVTSFKPDIHIEKITSRESFIALVVTDRIVNASAQAGVLPRQGNLPGINHLWSLLYRHIDIVIKDLNSRIAGGAAIETLLRRLVDLLSIDLSIMDPAWRSHVEGFAALVKLHGGVQKVLSVKAALERDQRVPPMALHYVLIYSTLANTASPASNQINGLANWSPDDIAAAYSHTGFHPAPCPTSVLQDIVRITRLRTMCLAEPTITSAFVPIAREVSRLLQTFDPEKWTEPYAKPEDPCMPLAGDLYKTASILYGLLSLPPVLAAEFALIPGSSPPAGAAPDEAATAVESGRVFYGNYLLNLVDRAMEELPLPQGVSWPIAVLGVAKHDAPQEEKDRLRKHLQTLRLKPGADSGAANIDIKLRDFWFFGHTQWEECYHEPINVIT